MEKGIVEFVLAAFTALLTAVGLIASPEPAPSQAPQIKETEPKPAVEQLSQLNLADASYRYAYQKITTPQDLSLFPNFSDKRAAQNLQEVKQCQVLVNGGFYSEDFKPLGWLVVEGSQVSAPIQSRLLDGFFSIDQAGKAEIDWQKPEHPVRIGLQSGPMLIWQGEPLPLQIKDDQLRRRIVLALTQNQELVFMAVTGDTSLGSGPYLADLPQIVESISDRLQVPFTSAVNLDGGSASAFLTEEIQLDEVTFIGSYFCAR